MDEDEIEIHGGVNESTTLTGSLCDDEEDDDMEQKCRCNRDGDNMSRVVGRPFPHK